MSKFKVGDHITNIPGLPGFNDAVVLEIGTRIEGKNKSRQVYLLKILNGIATIPISAESNYQLYKDKR